MPPLLPKPIFTKKLRTAHPQLRDLISAITEAIRSRDGHEYNLGDMDAALGDTQFAHLLPESPGWRPDGIEMANHLGLYFLDDSGRIHLTDSGAVFLEHRRLDDLFVRALRRHQFPNGTMMRRSIDLLSEAGVRVVWFRLLLQILLELFTRPGLSRSEMHITVPEFEVIALRNPRYAKTPNPNVPRLTDDILDARHSNFAHPELADDCVRMMSAAQLSGLVVRDGNRVAIAEPIRYDLISEIADDTGYFAEFDKNRPAAIGFEQAKHRWQTYYGGMEWRLPPTPARRSRRRGATQMPVQLDSQLRILLIDLYLSAGGNYDHLPQFLHERYSRAFGCNRRDLEDYYLVLHWIDHHRGSRDDAPPTEIQPSATGEDSDTVLWDTYAYDAALRAVRVQRILQEADLNAAVPTLEPEQLQRQFDEAFERETVRTRYERNPAVIREAKKIYGYICQVCRFDFERGYGSLGAGFIEVHHLRRVADLTPGETISMRDVTVVCSNCHRMLHRGSRMLTLAELARWLELAKQRAG